MTKNKAIMQLNDNTHMHHGINDLNEIQFDFIQQ